MVFQGSVAPRPAPLIKKIDEKWLGEWASRSDTPWAVGPANFRMILGWFISASAHTRRPAHTLWLFPLLHQTLATQFGRSYLSPPPPHINNGGLVARGGRKNPIPATTHAHRDWKKVDPQHKCCGKKLTYDVRKHLRVCMQGDLDELYNLRWDPGLQTNLTN